MNFVWFREIASTMRTTAPRTEKTYLCLPIGLCWLWKAFSRRFLYFPIDGPHARWYWCIVGVVEHEIAWGFPNNPTIDEIVHEFGQRSHDPKYDWGGARFQSIYRIISSEWSSPIDLAHEGSTILVLHVWWQYSSHAIQIVVHDTRLEPTKGVFFWCVDKEGNAMLADRELKPPKPIPVKNVEDIIKSILGFIQ